MSIKLVCVFSKIPSCQGGSNHQLVDVYHCSFNNCWPIFPLQLISIPICLRWFLWNFLTNPFQRWFSGYCMFDMLRMLLAVVSSSIRVFPIDHWIIFSVPNQPPSIILEWYSRVGSNTISLFSYPPSDSKISLFIARIFKNPYGPDSRLVKSPFSAVEISHVGIQLGSCSAASTCWTATSTSTTALWCGLGTWKAGKPLRLLGVSHWISTISIVKLTTTDLDHWISSLRGELSWFAISLHICVNLLESTAQIDVQNHWFLIWSHEESTFQLKLQVMNHTYYIY